jgi:NitT/TauT family transport system permease protein
MSELLFDALMSLQRVIFGVTLGALGAVALAILRSALPVHLKHNQLVKFLFDAPRFPPPIAWIPFVIITFGIGESAAVAIVFIGSFSPIFVSCFEGLESTPPCCEILRSLWKSKDSGMWRTFLYLLLHHNY